MADKNYLPGPKVDERYSIVPMTRHRWQKNPALNFPKPIIINGRKYWAEEELIAWERSRASASTAASRRR